MRILLGKRHCLFLMIPHQVWLASIFIMSSQKMLMAFLKSIRGNSGGSHSIQGSCGGIDTGDGELVDRLR